MSQMSQKVSFGRVRFWDIFGIEKKPRVFERISHDDKWTSRGRSWLAKRENFATIITEKRRSPYIYVRRVKVLGVFFGIRGKEKWGREKRGRGGSVSCPPLHVPDPLGSPEVDRLRRGTIPGNETLAPMAVPRTGGVVAGDMRGDGGIVGAELLV